MFSLAKFLILRYITFSDVDTNEEETDNIRFGIEASYVDGSPAPFGILGDGVSVDAQTGEIKLNGFKGDKLAPQRESLRVRVVAERIGEPGEPSKPMVVRYASKYIPVVTLGEDGAPIKGMFIAKIFIQLRMFA